LEIIVEWQDKLIGIELKYKKTTLNVREGGEDFILKADTAQDISRYDFIKDIGRLERFVEKHKRASGYATMLTNEPLFWKEGNSKNDKDFLIHEGRELKSGIDMVWAAKAKSGTTKGRTTTLCVKYNYALKWKPYSVLQSEVNKREFRYLLVEVGKGQMPS